MRKLLTVSDGKEHLLLVRILQAYATGSSYAYFLHVSSGAL